MKIRFTLLIGGLFFSTCIQILAPVASHADELIIISPHWEGFRHEFEEGFIQWEKIQHSRNVTFRWLDLGGASDISKTLIARKKAGAPLEFDVLFGGGVDTFQELKANQILKRAAIPVSVYKDIPQNLGGNPLWDTDGYWYGVNVTSFGIASNQKLLRQLGKSLPTTYTQLGMPEYRGWIGSADPRKSGSVRFIYELILQKYGWQRGWEIIFDIASNVRSFNNGSNQTPKDLATGEILSGILIDSYGLDAQQKYGADNIRFVVPSDVTSFFADPVAVGSSATHVELAAEFVQYCLSDQAQKRLLLKKGVSEFAPTHFEIGRLPVLPSVYTEVPSALMARPENPFAASEKTFTYDPKLAQKRWRIVTRLLGLIAVDLKESIEAARYAAISVQSTKECAVPISEEGLVQILDQLDNKTLDPFELEKKLLKIKSQALDCLIRLKHDN